MLRRWSVVPAKSAAPTEDAGGVPVYSLVSGALPLTEFSDGDAVFATAEFEVQVAGLISFDIQGVKAPEYWIDGKSAAATGEPIAFAKGRHAITFRLPTTTEIRVELSAPTSSPAKFQPVGGF